jgi:RND family efflux transporter MFP subunit
VVSNLDVDIKCRASGEVKKLPFDVSDKVKTGDLLFELDPTDMQRVVDRAKAALAQSQARLASARQNLVVAEAQLAVDRKKADASLKSVESRAGYARLKANRVKQTLEQHLSSQDEYDAANDAANQAEADLTTARVHLEDLKVAEQTIELRRQEVRLAEAQVDADKVALADAQQQLGYTRVVSPIDGVVSARNVQMGTIIASGISNVGGGTTALTVSDLSRLFVIASVDESDIGKVAGGQKVTVTADAFAGRRFAGQVVQIATRGVNASNVVTFDVKIEVLSDNKALLKPEMTANVEVVAAEKADVLLVPVEAVARQRGKQTVQVVAAAGAAPAEREVETGINDGTKVEILKGLAEGETVVLNKAADSRWKGGNQQPRPGGPMMMGGPPRR